MENPNTNDTQSKTVPDTRAAQKDRKRLMLVLSVVLIVCGGNGIGMIAGILLWKYTGMVALSIAIMIITTVAAFALAMRIILRRVNGGRKRNDPPGRDFS